VLAEDGGWYFFDDAMPRAEVAVEEVDGWVRDRIRIAIPSHRFRAQPGNCRSRGFRHSESGSPLPLKALLQASDLSFSKN
jgi:hypothetical protein